MPTLAVKTPANVDSIHKSFDKIVNFQIVSKEDLYDWIAVPLFGLTDSGDLFLDDFEFDDSDQVQMLSAA